MITNKIIYIYIYFFLSVLIISTHLHASVSISKFKLLSIHILRTDILIAQCLRGTTMFKIFK